MKDFLNTDDGGTLTPELIAKAMRQIMRPPERPPVLSRVYASHSVPHGRVFRMYTTRGELIAYVNRGEVADLPRARRRWGGHGYPGWDIAGPSLMGIPIYYD